MINTRGVPAGRFSVAWVSEQMINHRRHVAFLCVPDYLLAVNETRHLAGRSGHVSGRRPVSRVGAVLHRLPPGIPYATGETPFAPALAGDTGTFAFPVHADTSVPQSRWFNPAATDQPASMTRLRGLHEALLEVYQTVTPAVEEVGLGAAYMDLSGLEPLYGVPARQIAQDLVARAFWQLELPLVGGLARNKVLAHLAARHARLGQVFELREDQEQAFFDTEPLGALPGIGRGAVALLRDYGVMTIGDFGRLPEVAVVHLLGARARRLLAWARGEDSRPVRPSERSAVEQSAAVTFPHDTLDYAVIVEAAHRLTDQLLFSVRRRCRLARVVWVCVTHSDLRQARALSCLQQSTSLYPEGHPAVDGLLRCVLARRVRIRQLEVGLGRFVADHGQQPLFPDRRDRLARLCRSVDQVWSKYGRVVVFGNVPSFRRGWV